LRIDSEGFPIQPIFGSTVILNPNSQILL
jgi:hypothetical protein